MKRRKMFLVVTAGLAIVAGTALAHPLPKSVDPKPNAALNASPTAIRIGFSEGLVEAFSGIELDDESGKAVSTGTSAVDPTDSKLLILPLPVKLAPGIYIVRWHAVGDDTHHVTGHYSFQVK